MAGEAGRCTTALAVLAAAERPEQKASFDFFWAMRLLECANPERLRVGTAVTTKDEFVDLGQEPSLEFPVSCLHDVEIPRDEPGRPVRLSVLFFGLFGPNGPMPLHLTDYALQRRAQYKDCTLTRFLDVFHHRLLSILYRAWASARPEVNADRLKQDPEQGDRYQVYLGALAGSYLEVVHPVHVTDELWKLHYVGWLASRVRSREGLQILLAETFGVPVRIQECQGKWTRLSDDDLWYLGQPGGRLGTGGLVLGSSAWECQQSLRIVVGPTRLLRFESFLPEGSSLRKLSQIVKFYVGQEIAWDLKLILQQDEIKQQRIGAGARLGRASWLLSETTAPRNGEAVLAVDA